MASIPPPAPAAKPVEKMAPLHRDTLDDLAVEIPKGQSGGGVATPRVVFPKGWKSDGAATEEMLAERNDEFFAKMTLDSVPQGARFTVYRRAPRLESDSDKKAVYVVKVATAEAVRNVKKKIYAFKLIRTGDAIMAGDLLKLDR